MAVNSKNPNVTNPASRQKGSLTHFTIDKKLSIPLFIITAVAAVVLRFFQLRDNTDLLTGIYLDRSFSVDYPVMAIIAGLFLIFIVLLFGSSRDRVNKTATLENPMRLPAEKLNLNFHNASGALMIIAALTVFGQMVMDISYIITANRQINEGITDKLEKISVFTGIDGGEIMTYLLMIFTGFTLFSIGVNMIKGHGITKMNCFFLLFPVLWKVSEAFSVFFSAQEETRIINLYSEKLYIIFADICIVFMLLSVIRVYTSMEEKSTRRGLVFWGFASGVLISVSVLPRLICMFTMPLADITAIEAPSLSDVGFCVMGLVALMPLFSGFAYREVAAMTYKEGRRDHWISEIAGAELGMDTMEVKPVEADDETKEAATVKKEKNIDELF
jgi:hypothetical protein